jgi:hypothetical protein
MQQQQPAQLWMASQQKRQMSLLLGPAQAQQVANLHEHVL